MANEKSAPPAERTPNDQRSDVKNPNSPDHQSDLDNRSGQLDPQNPKYDSSRGVSPKG